MCSRTQVLTRRVSPNLIDDIPHREGARVPETAERKGSVQQIESLFTRGKERMKNKMFANKWGKAMKVGERERLKIGTLV